MKNSHSLIISLWLLMLSVVSLSLPAHAHGPFPTVHVKDLPDGLRSNWNSLKSEMTDTSHCAAAFDSNTEGDRMVFKCSIHIKMAHEGARRAMRYCEEDREKKHIHGPCKIVLEE